MVAAAGINVSLRTNFYVTAVRGTSTPANGQRKVTLLLGHMILMGAQWALTEVRLGQQDWKKSFDHRIWHDFILTFQCKLKINSLHVMSQYKCGVGAVS